MLQDIDIIDEIELFFSIFGYPNQTILVCAGTQHKRHVKTNEAKAFVKYSIYKIRENKHNLGYAEQLADYFQQANNLRIEQNNSI